MTARPESAAAVDKARRRLDDARRDLGAAEVVHHDVYARWVAAKNAWLAVPGGFFENPEYKAFGDASDAWNTAHAALATARNHVAACEIDLDTAQRYAGGEA